MVKNTLVFCQGRFVKDSNGLLVEIQSRLVLMAISESTCSAYDCEFVALAKEFGLPLVTFDKKILREFSEIAFHPEEFIKERPGF